MTRLVIIERFGGCYYVMVEALELFEKVSLLAKNYNISINKMMIRLLEIGYLEFIRSEISEEKIV